MKATTPKFKQIMASGNARDYVVKVDLTLADDPTTPTVLHLDESDIWNDSFSIETASSGTSSFDIGTAVIGQCKFSLNNFDERFNQYDFFNASAVVWVGLKGDTDNNDHQVYYRMGFFTVDEPTYAGSLIQLVLLDNMWRFDVPMITLNYPISCLNAVLAICSHCDVQLDQTVQFHGSNFIINEAPEGIDNMNCREFIQYVAMIGCNFCIITPEGKLKLRWYEGSPGTIENELDGGTFDTSTTPYSDGDNADGGNFTDYTSGDSYDGGSFVDDGNAVYFTRNFNLSVGTDEITITGVKFTLGDTAHTIGTTGYVLELENPLVNESNVNSVLNLIWDVLENFKLRTFNLSTTSNYPAEVGDCCVIKDYKGNYIISWITINSFKFASHQVQCNAIAPTRTLTKRYSKIVQAAVEEARQAAGQVISNYDLAVQMMNSLAVNAMGGYEEYEDLQTGGRVWYLSNMPITKNPTTGVCSFEPNSTVYKKSGSGFFVSRDGGTTWVNGYDMSTGELVVNVLDAIGINFDWARGGTLTLGGYGNGNGVCEVKDASNQTIVRINNDGITMYKGVIQSPDYSEVSAASTYATTGMKIDVINKLLKTPYFTINQNGAYFNGVIEIRGDIELGTGSFDFRPTDYCLADYYQFGFKAAEGFVGTSTVTEKIHEYEFNSATNEWVEKSGSPTTLTYTLTDDEETLSSTHNPTLGQNGHDYIEVTVSSSSTITSAIHDAILAKVDSQGFHGRLEGLFKGRIESTSGVINGFSYGVNAGQYGEGFFENSDGYEFNMRGAFEQPNGTFFNMWEGGAVVGGNEDSGGYLTGYGATFRLRNQTYSPITGAEIIMSVPDSGVPDIIRAVPAGGGAAGLEGALWRSDIQYDTTDLTAGTSPLETGKVYLVYE